MSDDIITRAEAALEALADCVWVAEVEDEIDAPVWVYHDNERPRPLFVCPDCNVRGGADPRDSEFIAAARSLLPELVAELKTTRAQLETLRAGLTRVEHFARIQALSERVRTGPAHSTYHCEERYWLDLLALIERAEVADV